MVLNHEGAILTSWEYIQCGATILTKMYFSIQPHKLSATSLIDEISVQTITKVWKVLQDYGRKKKRKKRKNLMLQSAVCVIRCLRLLKLLRIWYSLLIFVLLLLSPECSILDIPMLNNEENSTWVVKNMSRMNVPIILISRYIDISVERLCATIWFSNLNFHSSNLASINFVVRLRRLMIFQQVIDFEERVPNDLQGWHQLRSSCHAFKIILTLCCHNIGIERLFPNASL